MKTKTTTLDELISMLAYERTTYGEKELLLLLGGPVSFIRGLWRRDLHEAFFASASHCFSVMHSALNEMKKASHVAKLPWLFLIPAAGIQTAIFGWCASRIQPLFDSDIDVLAAHALAFHRPHSALNQVKKGLRTFPDSILLRRRLVRCFIDLRDFEKLGEVLSYLEPIANGISQEDEPQLFVRTAFTLAEGWKVLGDDGKKNEWKQRGIKVASSHKIDDQLSKLQALI